MLEPLERFFRRVGCLVLLDRAADPAANGHIQRNGTHIKAYSGGIVRSLSDLHASSHTHASHTSIGADDHHASSHTHASHTSIGASDHHAPGADISARVTHSAQQSISNAAWTTLNFDTETFDTDTIHDPATNNSRLTCKTAGKYIITGSIDWVENTTGARRRLAVLVNGVNVLNDNRGTVTTNTNPTNLVALIYSLAVNDYMELQAFQDSGGSLNVQVQQFAMAKVLG